MWFIVDHMYLAKEGLFDKDAKWTVFIWPFSHLINNLKRYTCHNSPIHTHINTLVVVYECGDHATLFFLKGQFPPIAH